MLKLTHSRTARLLAVVGTLAVLAVALLASNCQPAGGEGFAIYLPIEDIKASQVTSLSALHPYTEPLVSTKDIVSYASNTHEITLTPLAYSRLDEIVGMAKVPTWGKVFIVCVDRKPIYWGAFWPMYSSALFDGITIANPLGIIIGPSVGTTVANSIQIGMGYPTSSFYQSEDPRSDPAIMKSLRDAGKLK